MLSCFKQEDVLDHLVPVADLADAPCKTGAMNERRVVKSISRFMHASLRSLDVAVVGVVAFVRDSGTRVLVDEERSSKSKKPPLQS